MAARASEGLAFLWNFAVALWNGASKPSLASAAPLDSNVRHNSPTYVQVGAAVHARELDQRCGGHRRSQTARVAALTVMLVSIVGIAMFITRGLADVAGAGSGRASFSSLANAALRPVRTGEPEPSEPNTTRRRACGLIQRDTEYHTSRLVPGGRLWDVASAELCCAECEAHPECGAWTWGQARNIFGLSDVCLLQGLEADEQPKSVKRRGVVAGRPSAWVRKHGLVADLMVQEGFLAWRGVDQGAASEEAVQRSNATCPGKVNVTGYGMLNVVAALWREPGSIAQQPGLPSHTSLKSRLGSRVYFADNCTPGEYDQSHYVGLNLLGKSFHYTVDVSGAGCGCRARLQLLPLRSNEKDTACHDHYCDANATCGASCAEIDIQDSNKYAWSSRLHTANDTLGAGIGNGARGQAGRRDWTSVEYAPGGDCIDTSWPFEVTVSFPVGQRGELTGLDLVLTQAGRACSLSGHLDSYLAGKVNGMDEISAALAAGVTPVISYESSKDLLWLDGTTVDGRGPCLRDVPETCASAIHFYDFRIGNVEHQTSGKSQNHEVQDHAVHALDHFRTLVDQQPSGRKPDVLDADWRKLSKPSEEMSSGDVAPFSIFGEALYTMHKHDEKMADEEFSSRVKELSRALEDPAQSQPGHVSGGNRSNARGGSDVAHRRMVTTRRENGTNRYWHVEDDEEGENLMWDGEVTQQAGNIEWEIVYQGPMSVRADKNFSSKVIGSKPAGAVVQGERQGKWLSLAWEPGFLRIEVPGEARFLQPRRATYSKVSNASCADVGLFAIQDKDICKAASFAVGYFDLEVNFYYGNESRPEGCYLYKNEVWLATNPANFGRPGDAQREPLCSSQPYISTSTTTTTTISTTSSTSSTISTTTTTHWGSPSLFCFEVVRAYGYEPDLVRAQLKHRASIFGCDEYTVLSNGGVVDLGEGWKTVVIPAPQVRMGSLANGQTTNSWLNTEIFLEAWQLVSYDGRYANHDWTVKVDPDAVFFPERLRWNVRQHTPPGGAKLFYMNCNLYGTALYGSLEVFSKLAMQEYYRVKGRCKYSLNWHGWGEDMFMEKCMQMLGVQPVNDFSMIGDKRCHYASCWDKTKVAFHDFKSVPSWLDCWRKSR